MLLARETRCSVDEVRHYGAVAISTEKGDFVYGKSPITPVPLRSTAKPFMLGALLETFMAGEPFSARELALMSSSHNGEAQHVSSVVDLLARYKISPELIRCGIHTKWKPWSIESPLGNNCSGKHAAFLIARKISGNASENYCDPTSRIHVVTLECLSRIFGQAPIAIGVDGCSIPTYAYQLDRIASVFRRFAMDELTEEHQRVRRAHVAESFFVAGTDRLESYLIGHYGLAVKSGSDGLWAVGVPGRQLGIVVKVWGGTESVAQAVLLDILHRRAVIDLSDPYLQPYHNRPRLSLSGTHAGEFEVCFQESP